MKRNWQRWMVGLLVTMPALAAAGGMHGAGCGMGAKSCGLMGGGMLVVPALLLVLGFGYWILTLANKQDRPLDVIGRVVGGLVVLVSLVGLVCIAVCGVRYGCKSKAAACPVGAKAPACHPMGDAPASPAK